MGRLVEVVKADTYVKGKGLPSLYVYLFSNFEVVCGEVGILGIIDFADLIKGLHDNRCFTFFYAADPYQ